MFLKGICIISFLGILGILFSNFFLFKGLEKKNVILGLKSIAMLVSISILGLTSAIWYQFNSLNARFQQVFEILTFKVPFTDNLCFVYALGIDGISICFIILTAFIFPLCFLFS